MNIDDIKSYFLTLQNTISGLLQKIDPDIQMQEDTWEHKTGGGGITRAYIGSIIEKAGVNFSHVRGDALPHSALMSHRREWAGHAFQALGVSVVIHPNNPYVPTVHFNERFFSVDTPTDQKAWWFGGGMDLTPYYGLEEDCIHWHQTAKKACEPFGEDVYPRYKKACDDYFYLPHRQEPRGIGGLFFDDLNQWEFAQCFDFVRSIGHAFVEAYEPIINKRKNTSYFDREKNFQQYRRGRYVEFNLVYDRGTLFGLQSGGRTESILVSLPPAVTWKYDYHPEPNSAEAELTEKFLVKREWV